MQHIRGLVDPKATEPVEESSLGLKMLKSGGNSTIDYLLRCPKGMPVHRPTAYYRNAIGYGIPDTATKFLPWSKMKLKEEQRLAGKKESLAFTQADVNNWHPHISAYRLQCDEATYANNPTRRVPAFEEGECRSFDSPVKAVPCSCLIQEKRAHTEPWMDDDAERRVEQQYKGEKKFRKPDLGGHDTLDLLARNVASGRKHTRYRPGVSPQTCEHCDFHDIFWPHMQRNQIVNAPNAGSACAGTCALCGCRFRYVAELWAHVRTAHNGGEPICKPCRDRCQPKITQMKELDRIYKEAVYQILPCTFNSTFSYRHDGFASRPCEYVGFPSRFK